MARTGNHRHIIDLVFFYVYAGIEYLLSATTNVCSGDKARARGRSGHLEFTTPYV